MTKICVIGGGTGLSVIMRGLKQEESLELATIVTVADDGGSTGRLRERYFLPAMGDIRNVLVSMSEDENLFRELMDYRFQGDDGDVTGHNLGNLILAALSDTRGSFKEAIQLASRFLKIKGEIIPSSLEFITLYAKMKDGVIVRGESNIPKYQNQIESVFYDHPVKASAEAIQAIEEADYLIFGIGSLYTSIIPNVIIDELRDAILASKAKKIYICNAMSQPGETDGYTLEDHVDAIERHIGQPVIETVLIHSNRIEEVVKQRYEAQGANMVVSTNAVKPYHIVSADILTIENGLIRHDSNKIAKELMKIMELEE
ncbi:MAG: gluconeogenesis factor YvcK family protein [Erysipelotrichaceae bacterium]